MVLFAGNGNRYPEEFTIPFSSYMKKKHSILHLFSEGSGLLYLLAVAAALEIPFVLEAVQRALNQARPEIINSDQGSQFTSPQYISLLQTAGVAIRMDGRGRAHDNIFTERLWRSLKYEEVYLHEYQTPREARQGIKN